MRHHSMLGLAVLGVYFCISGFVLAGTYSGGDGSAGNPYRINSEADWKKLASNSGDWGKHFKLTVDISYLGGGEDTQVGNDSIPFSGIFDGNGHIIHNVYVREGLFGRIETNGQVKNLGLDNVVASGGDYVGGLVGRNSGTITDCYVIGSISGSDHVGGLVGKNISGTITTCYFIGSIRGYNHIGGIAGENWSGTISLCYAACSVRNDSFVRGVVGYNYIGRIKACFWEIQTSSVNGSSGGKGLTAKQMKTLSIYQNAGWGGKGWVMNDGVDYPRLSWEKTEGISIPSAVIPFSGTGTADNPYLISTSKEFALLSWYSEILDRHIKLTTNLDLNDYVLYPIGDLGPFNGVFDGGSYIISNAAIHQPSSDYVGIFSDIGSNGQVQRLKIENVNIIGDKYVGCIVGRNSGTITACYAIGSVNGLNSSVGGLAGINRGIISFSNVTCTVTGGFEVGGLIGQNEGVITDSYSAGFVVGSSLVGGLVGDNMSGIITVCYANGGVEGSQHIGGLVGSNSSGIILSCYATGAVRGSSWVGGLVGSNTNSAITGSYAIGSVIGDNQVGGLVGYNKSDKIGKPDTIRCSYADGMVTGYCDSIGGLIGENKGPIIACYATGPVIGFYSYIGGLVGKNSDTINLCYSTGTVMGYDYVGGLVGENSGPIKDCYATGSITGYEYMGGFAGSSSSRIEKCYSAGTVTGLYFIGGFLGLNQNGNVIESFWDTQSSEIETSNSDSGIQGKTTIEMQMLLTFMDAGWDFSDTDGDAADWWMPNHEYPRLSWEHPLLGTADNPYQIWTAEQLDNIGNNPNDWDKHFELMADIDMSNYSGTEYHIIGNSATTFTGTFDGNGHVIRNLSYSTGVTTDCIGLFGRIENAVIKNLILDDVSFSSDSGNVGGLVGWNDSGTLSRCVVRGGIQGTGHVGGLVGRNNGGVLTGCRTETWVNGTTVIGGLVGGNYSGSIENCYAVASVNGSGNYIGGLTGFNSKGALLECYAVGEFGDTGAYVGGVAGWTSAGSTVDACFWDMQVSGKSLGVGGGLASGITGKTTEEMQRVSTFTDAGWDFAGEADNGTVDYWRMCGDGAGYPRLSWEFGRRGDFACPDGVGVEDLEALGMAWLTAEGQAGYRVACDANSDGRIDMADFEVLAGRWMEN